MNIFEKEIMRRVKECDCDAVYRERDNSVSVMYDGEKIAEIHDGKFENISELYGEELQNFSIFDSCLRTFQITVPLTKTVSR